MKYIIVSLNTNKALYGFKNVTLSFSTYEIAYEVGKQFFNNELDFRIIEINL
jgi:hypothetical protein